MELGKGANMPIDAAEILVTVSATASVDIAALLLLTAAGKVRTGDDFVFYNRPTAPGVVTRPPDAIRIAPGAVPAEIDKIVITTGLDGTGPANWGRADPLRIPVNATSRRVADPFSEVLAGIAEKCVPRHRAPSAKIPV
ncbi:TerD family protein [Nocardia flavorosea]|uniref:TerD family protein n=1 Tax=Nocardia flavorosea TaxID=53429 RepID=A0A846YIQ8_9NOCA|nr:TerD family protein [Nocardia flavorosea]NKY57462.1 TerD family protein [Nocardia flavorosea]